MACIASFNPKRLNYMARNENSSKKWFSDEQASKKNVIKNHENIMFCFDFEQIKKPRMQWTHTRLVEMNKRLN